MAHVKHEKAVRNAIEVLPDIEETLGELVGKAGQAATPPAGSNFRSGWREWIGMLSYQVTTEGEEIIGGLITKFNDGSWLINLGEGAPEQLQYKMGELSVRSIDHAIEGYRPATDQDVRDWNTLLGPATVQPLI